MTKCFLNRVDYKSLVLTSLLQQIHLLNSAEDVRPHTPFFPPSLPSSFLDLGPDQGGAYSQTEFGLDPPVYGSHGKVLIWERTGQILTVRRSLWQQGGEGINWRALGRETWQE